MAHMQLHLNRPLTDGRAVCFDEFGPDKMPVIWAKAPALYRAAAVNFDERGKDRAARLVTVGDVSQVRPTGLTVRRKSLAGVNRDRVEVSLQFHPAITPYGVKARQH